MKTHKEFHLQLIQDLKKIKLTATELQECPISNDNSIAVMSVAAPSSTSISKTYSDEEKTRKVTYLSVRSNNRELSKCKVNNLLEKYKSQRLISYNESSAPSLGSKGGFSVTLNNKTIIIVFKFKNGMESTNFGGWNEPLKSIFEKKPELKRLPSDRNERDQLRQINSQIKSPIALIINGERFKNVVGFVGGKGGQKSDFVIVNTQGREIGWISYKSGKTSTSFQQYAGLTERSKLDNHPEVKKFHDQVESKAKELKEQNISVWKPIKDKDLKRKSVFGYDYGKKNGENNVDFLIQGNLVLQETNNGYILKSTGGLIVRNGDLSKLSKEYEPTLGVRPAEASRKYVKVQGLRGGIWPKKYITNRKKNRQIKEDGSIDMTGF
jgi:hypothetical protein